MSNILKNRYKSHFPEMNVHFHDKPVETYTVYYDKLSIDDGYICYELFSVTKLAVSYLHGKKIDNHFSNILEDNICAWGEII